MPISIPKQFPSENSKPSGEVCIPFCQENSNPAQAYTTSKLRMHCFLRQLHASWLAHQNFSNQYHPNYLLKRLLHLNFRNKTRNAKLSSFLQDFMHLPISLILLTIYLIGFLQNQLFVRLFRQLLSKLHDGEELTLFSRQFS